MISWEIPTTPLLLKKDDVHLWRASLNIDSEKEQKLRNLLSEDELIRADRFRFGQHRRRFVVTRARLRQILADYLAMSPAELFFDFGLHGKPLLCSSHEKASVNFNLSHSGDVVLYAFSRERQVGIDIEFVREKTDFMAISESWFRTNELAVLKACPEDQRRQCFFRGWTRKEAYLKALGEGIAYGLDRFEVSLQENDAALLWHQNGEQEVQRWQLLDLLIGADCCAALAVEGRGWQPRYFHFQN